MQVLVFDSCTFLLETVLEGRKEPVWQVLLKVLLLLSLSTFEVVHIIFLNFVHVILKKQNWKNPDMLKRLERVFTL